MKGKQIPINKTLVNVNGRIEDVVDNPPQVTFTNSDGEETFSANVVSISEPGKLTQYMQPGDPLIPTKHNPDIDNGEINIDVPFEGIDPDGLPPSRI